MEDGISFLVEFPSGYFVRKMFDSCKDLFVNMTIEFSKIGMKCYSFSTNGFEYVDITLNNIPGYQFNAGVGAINQVAKYVVNIKKLVSHIKSVTKQMNLIFKKESVSSKLIVQYGNNDDLCTWFESLIENNQENTVFPGISRPRPNCFVDYKDFKNKLTKPSIIGCKNVKIDSYETHIMIQAISDNDPEGFVATLGSTPLISSNVCSEASLMIPASMLKHISKQADMCRSGDNIYIYVEPSHTTESGALYPTFAMFQTSVGTYGTIKLYIATHSN